MMIISSGTTPLHSADGTSLLTDKQVILKRWAEHFDGVLNRPSSINDEAINRLPQVECNPLLDELPTISETVKAIKLLSSGKAPGSDAIHVPAEIYKAGGLPVAEKLTELFHIMWRAIPQEFKDATIIHLFKRKGNPQTVTIIEASLYCQLLGRSFLDLMVSFIVSNDRWTIMMKILMCATCFDYKDASSIQLIYLYF